MLERVGRREHHVREARGVGHEPLVHDEEQVLAREPGEHRVLVGRDRGGVRARTPSSSGPAGRGARPSAAPSWFMFTTRVGRGSEVLARHRREVERLAPSSRRRKQPPPFRARTRRAPPRARRCSGRHRAVRRSATGPPPSRRNGARARRERPRELLDRPRPGGRSSARRRSGAYSASARARSSGHPTVSRREERLVGEPVAREHVHEPERERAVGARAGRGSSGRRSRRSSLG